MIKISLQPLPLEKSLAKLFVFRNFHLKPLLLVKSYYEEKQLKSCSTLQLVLLTLQESKLQKLLKYELPSGMQCEKFSPKTAA